MVSPLDAKATVVFERHPICSESSGPGEYGRVGFAIGDRVFWTGNFYFPGQDNSNLEEGERLAKEVVSRWNAALRAKEP